MGARPGSKTGGVACPAGRGRAPPARQRLGRRHHRPGPGRQGHPAAFLTEKAGCWDVLGDVWSAVTSGSSWQADVQLFGGLLGWARAVAAEPRCSCSPTPSRPTKRPRSTAGGSGNRLRRTTSTHSSIGTHDLLGLAGLGRESADEQLKYSECRRTLLWRQPSAP